MSQHRQSPVIYLIDGNSAVSASTCAMLEAFNRRVERVFDAACFSKEYLETGIVSSKDALLVDLDSDRAENYRLLNLIMDSPDCPGLLLFSEKGGSFYETDEFSHDRLEVLYTPVSPAALLATLEAVL